MKRVFFEGKIIEKVPRFKHEVHSLLVNKKGFLFSSNHGIFCHENGAIHHLHEIHDTINIIGVIGKEIFYIQDRDLYSTEHSLLREDVTTGFVFQNDIYIIDATSLYRYRDGFVLVEYDGIHYGYGSEDTIYVVLGPEMYIYTYSEEETVKLFIGRPCTEFFIANDIFYLTSSLELPAELVELSSDFVYGKKEINII
jgi:hypothetical protein